MSRHEVAVVDYGVGNLLSVCRGLEHCGAAVTATDDPELIASAAKVVLPGVGAFADGMAELRRRGLDTAVREAAARGTPLLGICLGMQMLLDQSEEFGVTRGLGLIAGRVIAVPPVTSEGRSQKIPHIGWSALVLPEGREDWRGTPLAQVKPGEAVYFVHSFMAQPADPARRIGDCLYGGVRVAAVIGQGNVFGCQFHPEKSGETGLNVLRQFVSTEP
jgi:glutamine amidotransferase